ncbi:hypothetical protein [Cellulomonas sp. ATA003]|uniref:hypothetical protein n=1 Tax=Cellulomonas sp. ATA003 TaxID=3073064 RepID=UPI0028733327|nr:hypothetical protein [Cellulomonas sp. ATA003]WNB86344.1 hypothetical protein REH70_03585 [Cellulomonas sp. ATA003]
MKRTDAAALPTTFPTPAGAVTAARTSARRTSSVPTQRRRPAEAPLPLGSLLTDPAATRTAPCAQCSGTSLTRLPMVLTDGSAVTFVSCHDCETRAWVAADGAAVELDAVLSSATKG